MNTEEREIFEYLKTWGDNFVSAKEVCRRASTKKRYGENADWAKPVLLGMTQNGILENDLMGRYRIKPVAQKHKDGRWISPDIQKILSENGGDLADEAGEAGEAGETEHS